jgi:hypothetical protein
MIPRCWSRLAAGVAFCALVSPAISSAQDRSRLLLPVPMTGGGVSAAMGRAQPGVSTSSPLAFGPNWRDVFLGGNYQAEARGTDEPDGAVSAGFGLGDARTMAGVEVVFTSFSTTRGGFGNRMGLSLKAHRNLPYDAAIGVGIEGIMLTGDTDSDESFYVAVSKWQRLMSGQYLSGVLLNAGLGNGRFQSFEDLVNGEDGIGFFASAGLRLIPYVSAIGEWTGQDLNLGASLSVPIERFNFVLTPALVDVMEEANDSARFTLGFGVSWRM